jgi:predicted ArsR family transcriptional regulator
MKEKRRGGGWHGESFKPATLQAQILKELSADYSQPAKSIAADLGKTPQNVSNALRKMAAAGLITAEPRGRARFGRPTQWYRLNPVNAGRADADTVVLRQDGQGVPRAE